MHACLLLHTYKHTLRTDTGYGCTTYSVAGILLKRRKRGDFISIFGFRVWSLLTVLPPPLSALAHAPLEKQAIRCCSVQLSNSFEHTPSHPDAGA